MRGEFLSPLMIFCLTLCSKFKLIVGHVPELGIHVHKIGNSDDFAHLTSADNLTALHTVFLKHVENVPDSSFHVIIVTASVKEIFIIFNLLGLISETNDSCSLGHFLGLLHRYICSTHALDSLGIFSGGTGGKSDSRFNHFIQRVTHVCEHLLTEILAHCDKAVGTDYAENTGHESERSSAIMRVDHDNLRALLTRLCLIEIVYMTHTNTVATMNIIGARLLGKGVSDLKSLSAESLDNVDSMILGILLSTAGGVVLGKDCGATAGDFFVSECEHNFWIGLFVVDECQGEVVSLS